MISTRQANIDPVRTSLNAKYRPCKDNLIGYNLHDITEIFHDIPLSSQKIRKKRVILDQKNIG